ncbi:GIY-YIG nuclease family protein [Candidatus Microgenomates bacterium]|nr:GIY-YIG nuclease family protein [Candidatus Microgenomates bacterium]
MFYTYIIKSKTTERYYIGSTQNLEERLIRHNSGLTKSIKNRGPFKLIYNERYNTRQEAYRRERQIKRYKGGNAFKQLLEKTGSRDTEVAKRGSL